MSFRGFFVNKKNRDFLAIQNNTRELLLIKKYEDILLIIKDNIRVGLKKKIT